MSSPMPTVTLTVAYLYFVKYLGPRLMKNRPAMELRVPMLAYNFAMVVCSTYMFVEVRRTASAEGQPAAHPSARLT